MYQQYGLNYQYFRTTKEISTLSCTRFLAELFWKAIILSKLQEQLTICHLHKTHADTLETFQATCVQKPVQCSVCGKQSVSPWCRNRCRHCSALQQLQCTAATAVSNTRSNWLFSQQYHNHYTQDLVVQSTIPQPLQPGLGCKVNNTKTNTPRTWL